MPRAVSPSRGIDFGGRSEQIVLSAPGDGVAVMIRVVQPLGASTAVTTAWDGGVLTTRVTGIAALPRGSPSDCVTIRRG
jgi:hypothetical protein